MFDRKRHVAKELMCLLGVEEEEEEQEGEGGEGASEGALEWAAMALDDLVRVDRTLSVTKITETESAPPLAGKEQKKVDKELEKAGKELAKGDAARDGGEPDEAINRYEKAWKHATKTMKM